MMTSKPSGKRLLPKWRGFEKFSYDCDHSNELLWNCVPKARIDCNYKNIIEIYRMGNRMHHYL
jgi:hypothetical protein